jgi:glutaredoxin 3
LANVEIFTSPYCAFCYRAKSLLRDKRVDFTELDIIFEPNRRSEMVSRSNGQSTVPQIFINSIHIGGCDELYALEYSGKLDSILEAKSLTKK